MNIIQNSDETGAKSFKRNNRKNLYKKKSTSLLTLIIPKEEDLNIWWRQRLDVFFFLAKIFTSPFLIRGISFLKNPYYLVINCKDKFPLLRERVFIPKSGNRRLIKGTWFLIAWDYWKRESWNLRGIRKKWALIFH